MDAALAIAKYEDNDLDGALKDFYSALQKKPERSEFYFHYGLALLDNENVDMAREQFQLALEHAPKLEIAEQYLPWFKICISQPDWLGADVPGDLIFSVYRPRIWPCIRGLEIRG